MCLNRFVDLLPTVLPGLASIVTEAGEYSASVAIPPYFADTLPSMPVVSYYEIGMEPGAVPMQFVRFYADYYIPEIYTGVSFEDQRDLFDLYTAAATFFDLSITPAPSPSPMTLAPTAVPTNDSNDPTTAPVVVHDDSTPTRSPVTESISPDDGGRDVASSGPFVAGSFQVVAAVFASVAALLVDAW